MRKFTVLVLAILVLLGSVACGKNADAPQSATGGESSSIESDTNKNDSSNKVEYLDENTGTYYSHYGISFFVPAGWYVANDMLDVDGAGCMIIPADDTDEPSVLIKKINSNASAQSKYDDYLNGIPSHEVTYGSNRYISNETPTEDDETYFYYVGKSDPVVYLFTIITDGNKAALEEILTSFKY